MSITCKEEKRKFLVFLLDFSGILCHIQEKTSHNLMEKNTNKMEESTYIYYKCMYIMLCIYIYNFPVENNVVLGSPVAQ